MARMKHGLILMAPTIADQLAAARLAESRGFDSVWVTEFFNQHGFVRLAAVAQATARVKLGTAIAYAFMRTPLLASAAAHGHRRALGRPDDPRAWAAARAR